MSLLDRLRRRRSASVPASPPLPVDDGLEEWVVAAELACAGLGPAGRLVVAVLGESLVEPPSSPWFGYESTERGLADLLAALDQDPAAAEALVSAEGHLAGRRLGVLSDATRERWRSTVEATLRDLAGTVALPERDAVHREAEHVWRTAATGVQSWRAVQLTPDRALGQVRWYPGCATRTHIGYSDPLGVASVQRSVEEHRYTPEEWQALLPADELSRREVDPVVWRLSSLTFAVESRRGVTHG